MPTQAAKRSVLTLNADIYDSRPALVYEAEWRFNHAVEDFNVCARATRATVWALHFVLDLVEEGFEPARLVFYRMRKKFEKRFGDEFPTSVYERADRFKLIVPMHR